MLVYNYEKENKTMKQTLTLKNVNERIDKLEKKLDLMLKKLEKCEPKYPILSSITEVGTIVDLGAFKVRLLDTNYNGTGKKCWQPIDVLFPGEAGLGLPNDKNDGGYQRAIGLFKQFKVIYNMLETRIKDQIVNFENP